jgi:uncharacterized linocin/CFP29 family protein
MNGNLGRDRLWNEHIWSEIDKAVREEVGRIRVAQKVFPSSVVNNVLPVVANTIAAPAAGPAKPAVLRTGDDQFRPFVEMSIEFVLTQAQVDGEENVRLAPTLARRAASAIAAAEDAILFLGNAIVPAALPHVVTGMGVTITNRTALPPGFVAETAANPPFTGVPGAGPGVLGDILGAVAAGIAALNGRAQPGPYALFLPPDRYAQTFAPVGPGMLETPGDQINHVVTGGFYMANSLPSVRPAPPPDIGILVSLGGEPARIILGTEAMTAFTHTDAQGNHHFRVFERIQMVVQDARAFQRLTFP